MQLVRNITGAQFGDSMRKTMTPLMGQVLHARVVHCAIEYGTLGIDGTLVLEGCSVNIQIAPDSLRPCPPLLPAAMIWKV